MVRFPPQNLKFEHDTTHLLHAIREYGLYRAVWVMGHGSGVRDRGIELDEHRRVEMVGKGVEYESDTLEDEKMSETPQLLFRHLSRAGSSPASAQGDVWLVVSDSMGVSDATHIRNP